MTYDPLIYWTDRGRTFATENPAAWDAEDTVLRALLDRLAFDTVFEVGCGYGRVGAAISRSHPRAHYTGLDISPDLAATTAKRMPDATIICADLATYQTDARYDLVLAISVLGHLLPDDVGAVLERLRSWATRDLVVMDWDETGQRTGYQFAHDYRALMPNATRTPNGQLSIYHERYG